MELRVIDRAEQFIAIGNDWNRLLEFDENASVFMSWEWNHNWWQHYGDAHDLRIVTVWDDNNLQAILPIYLQKTRLYKTRSVITARFIGTGSDTSPDYLGPILHPATATIATALLVSFILDQLPEWDVLRLSDLDQNSGFFAELKHQCQARRYPIASSVSATIAYASLPPSWDDYLASLHGDRRNTIRRTRRKVEAQHMGRFYVVSTPDQVDAVLTSLIELHQRRWQGNPEGHSFSTPQYVGFHRDVISAAARRGWIRLYCLEADGKRIAVLYCYRFRNQIFYFQAGFDPDYERLRPGLVLIGYAFEDALKEGNTVFDFLRGDHGYKTQWGKSQRETHTLVAYRRSLSGVLSRVQSEVIPKLKAYVKTMFPFLNPKGDAHKSIVKEHKGIVKDQPSA